MTGGGRLVVFDLDGTLIDSLPDMAAAVEDLLNSYGMPSPDAAAVRTMIGDGVAALVERALAWSESRNPEAPPAIDRVEATSRFMALYSPRATKLSQPFPRTRAVLELLRKHDWNLAVCTNKPEAAARTILEEFELAPLFDAIGGGDSFPTRKPDPGHLLGVIDRAGGTAHRTVMVGDHANDIRAAAGAGTSSIFAEWGYCSIDSGAGATYCATKIDDVPAAATDIEARWLPT
ncbi:phosphoglycolate phosphatase [Acetobacter nitrogenifigens DSM 23921 = NBRC 105050]|uniref:phosphoglycolate phosphatase n=1 Tax=Acetobacter nitrogenifigens DSM 23921 = NBRC 105050 TaxID=1120919 RepID=A0A511X5N5_9PROT|nr:HAD-IA family hydrolase [Acetobacter nitrogenifigens]GBQ98368.1 phosphoglycolate phosphatase [Acetobacter nitrogenifigens DSM 23921 = NBRC 105050]GEN58259.1 phosphoglycolate phosphatase [Acetobacter nitrogenifigens DSM 23921 = NBRC 105050]